MKQSTTAKWMVQTFDSVVERFELAVTSFTEEDALKASHWDHGEDARLREDIRFRPTPWGRWILSNHLLVNDKMYKHFQDAACSEVDLKQYLAENHSQTGRRNMFCHADPRFAFEDNKVKLAARELTDQPMIEEPLDIEKYVSHLPIHSLKAVAASEPADEWGTRAQEEMIETLGWVRVRIPGLKLNDRMFIAQIMGRSMDNGHNALTHGTYAIFQLWPVGTRQGKIVLVRGSFSDPETGTYALKKYIGDIRDEEGMHHTIKLISANPDKEHYPDIVLSPDQDISVIAEMITPLSPGDYGREPKKRTSAGKRDLISIEARAKIEDRLQELIQNIFSSEPAGKNEEGEEPSEPLWTARIICLEGSSGGLHIEAGPLIGLPQFAKTLQVNSGTMSWKTLASNFRTKNWRIQISPSCDPYEWSAPGFEDVLEEDLDSLSLCGLSADSATLFRVDAEGVGVLLNGATLSPGQTYRVLIPPRLHQIVLPEKMTNPLVDGWNLLELQVPVSPDVEFCTMLSSLKLNLGKDAPILSWVITPPNLYKKTPVGEQYPCFSPGQMPILSIEGISCMYDGEASVFLSSSSSLQSIPLPRGESWHIAFSDLSSGSYLAEVLHSKTRIEPVYTAFSIDHSQVSPVCAEVTVQLEGKLSVISEIGKIVLDSDFSVFNDSLVVSGPPLWPVSITWDSGKLIGLEISSLEEDGSLDTEKLSLLTEDLRSRCRVANLIMDFKDLGNACIQLYREPKLEELFEEIKILLDERMQAVDELEGQYQLLKNLWIEPLLQKLNYGLGEFEQQDFTDISSGICVLKLLETSRTPQGRVREELRRILILTRQSVDLQTYTTDSVRSYADALCWKAGVREAILTDGLRWALHKRGGKVRLPLWDLRDLMETPEEFDFSEFVYHFAVGV